MIAVAFLVLRFRVQPYQKYSTALFYYTHFKTPHYIYTKSWTGKGKLEKKVIINSNKLKQSTLTDYYNPTDKD